MASFPASLAFEKPRRIVFGVDSSPYAERAFRWASENLLRSGDEVYLVHALQQAIVATATMQVAQLCGFLSTQILLIRNLV